MVEEHSPQPCIPISGVTLNRCWTPTGMIAVILQGTHTSQLDGQYSQPTKTSPHFTCLEFLTPTFPNPGQKDPESLEGHISASYFTLSVPLSLPTLPVPADTGTVAVGGYTLKKLLKKALRRVGLAMPWEAVGWKVSDWCVWGSGVWQGSEAGKDARGLSSYLCVFGGGESRTPSVARHPGGQCPEKCRRCGLDIAGLSAERGTERPVLGVSEGQLAKRLGPNKVSLGSVSPQSLATYYHSQAR